MPIITQRVDYEEEKIWEASTIQNNKIIFLGCDNFSPIEIITALSVRLHNSMKEPKDGRKWLDAKLNLERPLSNSDLEELEISLSKMTAEFFTRSVIKTKKEKIGTIFFSYAEPRIE